MTDTTKGVDLDGLEARIGQEFDGELHLTEEEGRALIALARQGQGLEERYERMEEALETISRGGPDIGPITTKTGREYRHGFDQGCAWSGGVARQALSGRK